MREQKSFPFQVKAVDDEQGLIEAYGSVFEVEDQGGDIVRPGAFKRTIQNSKARVAAGKAKWLAVMLWQHDPNIPIGGWADLKEDDKGLLCKGQIILMTQQGKEAYELIKNGVIQEFSIGYDIPSGGATWDSKDAVRNLTELRLWEVSPVTFAMQEEALLVDVKSQENKSVCGNTSGPIGPRDESWDGGAAKKWIWGKALDADGKVKTAVAKKYFMQCDGDPSLKGSYGYPFWVNDHISVGGVKAIAGALSGARNADAGGDTAGLKSKVETLYRKINSKYPDDPELTPKWKDEGKGSHMNRQQKTFQEHYTEEQCEDLLEDWQDVLICALSCAVLDAFQIGDQPEADIKEALIAFEEAVMQWVAQGVQYKLSDYLEEHTTEYSAAESLIQYGSESKPNYGYGYMSRSQSLSRKAGRVISASNAGKIQDHIDSINDMADTHEKAMKTHTKALRSAADDLATVLQGSEAAYGSDTGKPDEGQQEGKNRGTPSPVTRTTQQHSSQADTVDEQDITSILGNLKALHA